MAIMNDEQKKIHSDYFDEVSESLGKFMEKMGESLSDLDKGLSFHDLLKIGISGITIPTTVSIGMASRSCLAAGKEIGKPEVGLNLLMDVVSNGIHMTITDVLPEIVGKETASLITKKMLTTQLEQAMGEMGSDSKIKADITFAEMVNNINKVKH